MSKPCGICQSSKRAEVDQALVSGMPVRQAEAEFGFSKSRLFEHKKRCIAALVQSANAEQRQEQGGKLLEHMKTLQKATFQVLGAALKGGDASGVLSAVREARQNVLVMGQLLGRIGGSSRAATINNAVAVKIVYQDSPRDSARSEA